MMHYPSSERLITKEEHAARLKAYAARVKRALDYAAKKGQK